MKVLFICSGNSATGLSPVVSRQGASLEEAGITLGYFPITGKGVKGYRRNIFLLRKHIRSHQYDIFHAHYSLSGIIAVFSLLMAGKNPRRRLLVSLMGSDLYQSSGLLCTARFFTRFCWGKTIVKSSEMKTLLNVSSSEVVPNGVNMKVFSPSDKLSIREKLGYDRSQKLILFIGDPKRPEKNYSLANDVIKLLNDKSISLIVINNRSREEIADYLNAADLLLSTSLWEGSANVIKEAMACNVPVIATPAGDAKELLEDCEGNFVTTFDPGDISGKIRLALSAGRPSKGRDNLIRRSLDDVSVAERLIGIYKEMMGKADFKITSDINAADISKWHEYVFHHPHGNVFQSPEMYQVLSLSKKTRPIALFCLKGSDICGVAVFSVSRQFSGPAGRLTSRAVMTGGPLVDNDDPEIVTSLLDKADIILDGVSIYFEIRNLSDTISYSTAFNQSGFKSEPHLNILIDLSSGTEELWKNLHPTRRKQISRSRRRSVIVRSAETIDEETIKECYSILKRVYRKAHLPLESQLFFISSITTLFRLGLIRVFLAEVDTRIIGFRFVLCYRDSLYDWYAASDESFLDRYPNDLLPWEVMAKGAEEGFSLFDFGGAGRPDAKYGVRDFKLKFGGTLVNFGRYMKVYDPILYFVISRVFGFYRKIFRLQ